MDVTRKAASPASPQPHSPEPDNEDLVLQALKGMDAARALCHCGDFHHHTRGLLRARGNRIAVKRENQILQALLSDLIRHGTRILIASAPDAGMFCLCGQAAQGRETDITVLDRCAAPLALIASFARERDRPVRTVQADFAAVDEAGSYDIVLAHHMLRFVARERRGDAVKHLARALKPSGTLICSIRDSWGAAPADLGILAAQWLADTEALRQSAGLKPPPTQDELTEMLKTAFAAKAERTKATPSVEDAKEAILAAGLTIICEVKVKGGRAPGTFLVANRS